MRAIQVTHFGGPEVLVPVDVPDPIPGAGTAVIDVAAADVLFLDAVIRYGLATDFFPLRPPYVPGNGVAGTVISVGRDTDGSWIGRRVVAHTGGANPSDGYAQRAVVAVDDLVRVPEDLGLFEAAALLHDGATALGLVESFPVRQGEWVLVVGASGGLGAILVQLARAVGGRVIGAARGRVKLDLSRELGADLAVDDSDSDWPKAVIDATEGHGADLVFDNVGGSVGLAAFGAVSAGGRFSAHGAPAGGFTAVDPTEAARLGVSVRGIEQVQFSSSDLVRLTRQALVAASEGRIRPIIGQTFPLERATDAHRAIEARSVIGKTLLCDLMPLDQVHVQYLSDHHQGRLATVATDGTPQNKPVGYRYNPELGTIDIAGFDMDTSAKYRNIAVHPDVSFVVDDAIGEGASGMRFLEVHGRAEQATVPPQADDGLSSHIIRIHPRRAVSWNADSEHPGLRSQTLPRTAGAEGTPDERPTFETAGCAADEGAAVVANLVAELQAGIDTQDAIAYNRHFAADIIWGSPYGATVRGYDDLHAIHASLLGRRVGGPSSRYEIVQVLSPTPDVVVAHVRRVALDSDGQPFGASTDPGTPFSEMALYILVRRGGDWWLAAGQNTPIAPTGGPMTTTS